MQFDNGATVTFTMVAFTDKVCARQIRIFGTKVRFASISRTFPEIRLISCHNTEQRINLIPSNCKVCC